jgi:alpha-tubulin suppressor-like RCC1 family protein
MRRVSGLCVVAVFACGLLVAACAPAVVPPGSSTTTTTSTTAAPSTTTTELPTTTTTTTTTIPAKVTSMAAGTLHSCARFDNGHLKCWGYNNSGRLGNGANTSTQSTPVSVKGIDDAVSVTAGQAFTCALRGTGSVSCWGSNTNSELGDGTTTNYSLTPTSVTDISDAAEVHAGNGFACALRSTGGVRCWGFNSSGQLGNGTRTESNIPVNVSGLTGASALSVGYASACAIVGGDVWCWGYLGNQYTSVPVKISGVTGATALTSGVFFSCALVQGGAVKCWGRSEYGQTGSSTTANYALTSVRSITGATSIDAGAHHVCVVDSSSAIQCWGKNSNGELGNNSTADSYIPVAAQGLTGQVGVAAGGLRVGNPVASTTGGSGPEHTCSVSASGEVSCWGFNAYGQLGNGNLTDSAVPVRVAF